MSTTSNIEAEILSRLELPLTPEGARDLAKLEFSSQDSDRMRELLEKGNRGLRTPEEDMEASDFERVGHVFSMIKSIARRTISNS